MDEPPPFDTDHLAVEWPLLLECASPSPDERRLAELLRQPVDWNVMLLLAEEHGVVGLLNRRFQENRPPNLPPEICQELQQRYRTQSLFTLSMTAQLFRVLDDLSVAGIDVLVVKGPVLSALAYGDPGLRQYADVDLLVRDRDILRATQLMLKTEFEADVPAAAIEAGKIPGEYLFRKPNTKLLFDLHTEHTLRYFPRPVRLDSFFERKTNVLVDKHAVPALCAEDELIFGCVHGAKHFWERLMWVADVAAMVTRPGALRWNLVQERAKETIAERMLYAGLLLAGDLLHAVLPEQITGAVRGNSSARKLVDQIKGWLPMAGHAPPGIVQRALFRMRMRGGVVAGPIYLLRLSFLPTEEDWVEGAEANRPWLLDAMRRPFRLAKKYGRDGRN